MQPIKYLNKWLEENANERHYLFTSYNLRTLFPQLSSVAFKTLLSRAVDAQILTRVCRGIYLYKKAMPHDGLLLFHIAAVLRANNFNYVSLETALSNYGLISQLPINWISIMSSGRSNTINCDNYGSIEFVHTEQQPRALIDKIVYDPKLGLWQAKADLALRDMRRTGRSLDLILDNEV